MMSIKGVGFFVVCLVLCALRVGEAVREVVESFDDEVLLRRLVDPGNGGVDVDTAELIWYQCRRDLIYEEVIGGLDVFLYDKIFPHAEEINSECCISAKDIIQRILLAPYPQLKRSLLNCLRENKLLLLVSGEDGGSKGWFIGYLKYIVPGLRWNLRRELLAETTALAPSLSPAPAPAPGPSSGSPQSSPAPSPALSPQLATSPSPSVPPPFFPALTISPPPQGVNHSESTDTGSNGEGKGKNSNHRTVITAVVVTAAVTFIVASLIFLCWSKIRKAKYGDRRNDERPLLSLSLNDYSLGSSHKPFASGNSVKEDMLAHQTYDTSTLQNGKSSQDELYTFHDASKYSSASFGLSDNNNIALSASILKPTSGLPPLRPPPGRISALPPEPPASLKPPSFKGNSAMTPPVLPPARPPHTEGGPPLPGPPPAPPMASGARPPPPPPVPSATKPGPPPPPKNGVPPPRPPPPAKAPQPPPIGGKNQSSTSNGQGNDFGSEAEASKPKLKPFFWDKVQANPDHSMVWNQIKSGSFQFNEEEIETLFGYGSVEKKNERKNDSSQEAAKLIQIIDSKKAQNLSILLRALNVTLEEVCDALHEGNELPVEFLQTVLKMAPTADEELKLRLFSGELSQLGPADRFLKAMADIPFAFKRFEALLFISTLQEDVTIMKESFATLEIACKELRNSRLFLKLLEAVLKTGNRMNDGTFRGGALAFKLDTLLKLSDVKGVDGKTTLLHFVVQEIIRSEGMRAARAARESQSSSGIKSDDIPEVTSSDTEENFRRLGLQVVSSLGSELENVKKAAVLDADSLSGTVVKLGSQLVKTRNFLNTEFKGSEEENGFSRVLKCFIQNAENDVKWLQEEEKRIMALVKNTGDYFHGKAGKDEGLRLFVIVRDFLIMLDKACKEVRLMEARRPRITQKKENTVSSASPSEPRQPPSPDLHRRLFPAIADRRISYSSSDDEGT